MILTESTFNEAIQSEIPVLVDFWAEWCPPCKTLSPILDKIQVELYGDLIIAKVDADQNPLLLRKYDILSLPTMILFKDGEVVETLVGAMSAEKICERLAPHLEGEQ